ncbi:MAG: hypothetical protein J2P27_01220 [Actinobacteria bacterium]|nr:hypothetical protein [Actinomycetota bacterium]
MREAPGRPGPAIQVGLTERWLRKRQFLEKDERILEWKQGKLRRWLVDGSNQPIPKFHGLERVPILSGVTSLSYSPRCLFITGTDRFAVTDLAFIVRIWSAAPRSVCVMYSTFGEQSAGCLVSIRWDSDELESFDELVAFADRIRVRARDRRAGFSADWQARIERRVSEITDSATFESDLAELDEAAAGALPRGPRTVVGLWFRAVNLGTTEERDRLSRLLNGGEPGWNDDEPAVVQAASELAARRYFGPKARADQIAATAAQVVEADRGGADLQGRAGSLPDKTYVQAVIRYDTGDRPTGWDNIRPSVALHIRIAFIAFVVVKLDIMFELDQLIRDAEALAFERGLSPPLAAQAA